jgi:hypothetical protein
MIKIKATRSHSIRPGIKGIPINVMIIKKKTLPISQIRMGSERYKMTKVNTR